QTIYASSGIPNVDGCVLRHQAEAQAAKALSCRADARTANALQSGLRRLWEDPIPWPYSEEGSHPGGVFSRRRRVRRAYGEHSRRRTVDASPNYRDRGGFARAQEVHLPLHERPAAERAAARIQAEQIFFFCRPHGWPARAPRFFRVPGGNLRQGG